MTAWTTVTSCRTAPLPPAGRTSTSAARGGVSPWPSSVTQTTTVETSQVISKYFNLDQILSVKDFNNAMEFFNISLNQKENLSLGLQSRGFINFIFPNTLLMAQALGFSPHLVNVMFIMKCFRKSYP